MNLAKGGVGALEASGPTSPPPPGQLYQVSRNGKHRHQLAKGKIFTLAASQRLHAGRCTSPTTSSRPAWWRL